MNRSWSLSTIGDWDSVTENGTTENRTHTAAHEIETIDGNAVTHDAKGNLTSTADGRSFVWDFDNRLASATVGANSDGIEGTHSYTYDALGRRVTKTVNDAQANSGAGETTTTLYVCAGQQVLCEYSVPTTGPPAANAPDQRFVYGAYVDEPILKDGLTNGTTGVVYYSRNQQYSVTALTNATGSVIERYAYTAYGQTKIFRGSGVPLATSARQNEYTYTGRRADRETGLMYFRARMYDAQLGRFASRDPLGFVDGMSLYRGYFVPGGVDPSGKRIILVGSPDERADTIALFNQLCPDGGFRESTGFGATLGTQSTVGMLLGDASALKARPGFCNGTVDVDFKGSMTGFGGGNYTPPGYLKSSTPKSCAGICRAMRSLSTFRVFTDPGAMDSSCKGKDVRVGGEKTNLGLATDENGNPTSVPSPPFIILAHELLGHAMGHHGDDTIDVENEIREEHGIGLRDPADHECPGCR